MLRRLIHEFLYPRCPYEPPPDTVTDEEHRQSFEEREREMEERLRYLRYQADMQQRGKSDRESGPGAPHEFG